MGRIDDIFARHRAAGTTALMPYVTGGHPTLATTRGVLRSLQDAGASIVEIGFPFSDPIADGPVIAEAMHAALLAGVTPTDLMDLVREVRPETELGLVGMVSQSIVERIGVEPFVAEAAAAGFDGLIVPDVDVVAARTVRAIADDRGLTLSMLVAPTTSPQRTEQLAGLSSGFIYLLARAGITGEQSEAPQLARRIEALRNVTDLPVAVGFGISTPEHVRAVTETADAAIIGSALVRRMTEADDPIAAARRFVTELAGSLARR